MNHHNATASSTGNISTVPTHIKDFASFSEDQLLDFFQNTTGYSETVIKASFAKEDWGTIEGFLEHSRKQKNLHEEMMNGGPDGNGPCPMQLGVSPTPSQGHCYTMLS